MNASGVRDGLSGDMLAQSAQSSYVLNQKCLYNADLRHEEFLKICDFLGYLEHDSDISQTISHWKPNMYKIYGGKNNSFLTSIRRLCYLFICLSVHVCNYSNRKWRLCLNAMHPQT